MNDLGVNMRLLLAFFTGFFILTAQSHSEQLIESYGAFIGDDDLYNSKGARLSHAWQIIRQDRANYHRFGRSQPGDEGDNYFSSIDNRAALENMVRRGSMSSDAARRIEAGYVQIFVDIYGVGNRIDYINVSVGQ